MTEASEILKHDYLPVIREQLPNKTPLYSRLNKGNEDVVGDEARMALRIGRNQGVGARSDGERLPDAGGNRYKQIAVPTRNIYGRLEIAGKVFKAARSNRGAFINAAEAEMKGLLEGLTWDLNRELFNVPLGTLATLGAGGPANTFTVTDSNASYKTRWLYKDAKVDIYDSTGTTPKATARTITAVNKSTNEFTVDGAAVTVVAGDVVCRAGAVNRELHGLGYVLTPGNTLYGIDRSQAVNSFFNPQVFANGGTNRAISETLLQTAIDEAEIATGGSVSLMISSHGVRRAYQELLVSYKRYTEPKRLQGGWSALDYNSIPWVVDPDMKANTIYMLDEATFKIHTMIADTFEWGEEDGLVLRQVSNYDSYEAWMVGYMELVCDTPSKNVVIQDITEK